MAQHCGYVIKVENLTKHPNADRLQLLHIFGTTTTVGLDVAVGDMGIYFPTDLQLSIEYCVANHLCRKNPLDGTADSGYMDGDKRNVTAIKLRGERSDGIYVPLSSLETFGDISKLKVGDTIDTFNGHLICEKYIPRSNKRADSRSGNGKPGKKKAKIEEFPNFVEHIDTPQLQFCMEKFKPGDIIVLTEKVHGTSSRNSNTLCVKEKKNWFQKLFHLRGKKISEYRYVVGTRRTRVNEQSNDGGFYGSHKFRLDWGERFKGKLLEGENVFGEIAGFTDTGNPIMGVADNKKTNDKEFIKKYGAHTVFTYGCSPTGDIENPQSRYFIYRMNYTTPDGTVIEYSWDQTRIRAEQMGVEVVPELDRFIYTTEDDFIARINKWLDIPSTIDPRHIIEGVVVRALNRPGFAVAKAKSFLFKVIEGICKAEADTPDMEEAQDVETYNEV